MKTMYVCGPTVYDYLHIGNIRPVISFDFYRRALIALGEEVKYVTNITDIDDKIINKANELCKTPREISEKYSLAYLNLLDKLNINQNEIEIVKVTEVLEDMIQVVESLLQKGYAYELSDGIYLNISNYPNYGIVSGNVPENLVQQNTDVNPNKKNVLDFALWKFDKNVGWEAPFGFGRPGWHTECVAIINKVIGKQVDIHGGGSDLRFPHHENENIQNYYLNNVELAKEWLHNGFVNIDNEKMSKSLGNVVNADELLNKYGNNVVRLFYLDNTISKPINFSYDELDRTKKTEQKIKTAFSIAKKMEFTNEIKYDNTEFVKSLFDSGISSPKVITKLIEFAKILNSGNGTNLNSKRYIQLCDILGLDYSSIEYSNKIIDILSTMEELRVNKQFEKYDDLCEKVEFNVVNTRQGVILE